MKKRRVVDFFLVTHTRPKLKGVGDRADLQEGSPQRRTTLRVEPLAAASEPRPRARGPRPSRRSRTSGHWILYRSVRSLSGYEASGWAIPPARTSLIDSVLSVVQPGLVPFDRLARRFASPRRDLPPDRARGRLCCRRMAGRGPS